ncbi:energy-coupling factor ABC transporter ATP-binding protein [candidate division KSB1 bacterium]
MDPNIIVQTKDLSYKYPNGTAALENISLEIKEREKIAVLGPNGAGKSTLLLSLIGILKAGGDIHVNGLNVEKRTLKQIRRSIGFVFQDPDDQLFSPTVYDDIAFGPAQFDGNPENITSKVDNVLQLLNISHLKDKRPVELSSGEKKSVSLATALVLEPKILILDEPSSSLDPKHRRQILNFLIDYQKTIIIATHDLDFAAELCDRCLILHKGKVVADDSTQKILTNKELLESNDLELPLGQHF